MYKVLVNTATKNYDRSSNVVYEKNGKIIFIDVLYPGFTTEIVYEDQVTINVLCLDPDPFDYKNGICGLQEACYVATFLNANPDKIIMGDRLKKELEVL